MIVGKWRDMVKKGDKVMLKTGGNTIYTIAYIIQNIVILEEINGWYDVGELKKVKYLSLFQVYSKEVD